MSEQPFVINGTTFTVVTNEDGQIEDITVSTSYKNYRDNLLPNLSELGINTKNTPYARMFRNPLAKFSAKTEQSSDNKMLNLKKSMDALSRLYDKFDGFINQGATANPIKAMDDLLTALGELESNLQSLDPLSSKNGLYRNSQGMRHFLSFPRRRETMLDKGLSSFVDEIPAYAGMTTTAIPVEPKNEMDPWADMHQSDYAIQQSSLLARQLLADITAFKTHIKTLKDNVPTAHQVKQLMSIQTQDANIPSLGSFVAEQLIKIAATGIKIAYHLSDNRLKDMIHVPPLVAALSDAKKMLELKARSLDGAEYNDAYSKMPLSTIEQLDKLKTRDEEEITFSLRPYLASWNVSELDQLVCFITKTDLMSRTTPSMWFDAFKLVASLLELAVVMCIRLPLTLILVCVDLVGRMLGLDTKEKWTDAIDQTLSDWHEKLSPVIFAKQLWNARYKRLDEGDEDKGHQALLDTIKNEFSHFQVIAKEYSANHIASFVVSSLKIAYENIKQIPQDVRYLFSKTNAQTVYDDVVSAYQQAKSSQMPATIAADANLALLKRCPLPAYAHGNHISSPFEVPREVVYAITDAMVDPFFRKSPATSTLFFALSAATFGTYLLPAALFAGMKSVVLGLQLPTNALSKAFTGRLLVEGMQDASVACFLEWQALVLLAELGIELSEGDFDVLAQLFQEPEIISMALVGLVAIGMGLQFIPTIPSTFVIPGTSVKMEVLYASLLNLFTEEAKSSAHGIYPFSLVTKAILGLKAGLLLHSMVSTGDEPVESHTQAPEIQNMTSMIEAGQLLEQALMMLSDSSISLNFSSDPLNGQRKFYDHLNTLFDNYNHALQIRGRADLCIDKQDVLDVFYNKYCKKEVNNALCILSILPAYPITLLWRSFKWAWATTFHKPSVAHEVEVQFYKDIVLALQLVAMMTKTMYSVGLAVSYTIRPIAALFLFATTAIPYLLYRLGSIAAGNDDVMTCRDWLQTIDETVCKISLHEAQLDAFLRPIYAVAARKSGSNTNVSEMSQRAHGRLLESVTAISQPIQKTRENWEPIDANSRFGQVLERHDRAVQQGDQTKAKTIEQEYSHRYWVKHAFFAAKSLAVDLNIMNENPILQT